MWSDRPKKVGIGAGSLRYPTSLIWLCYRAPMRSSRLTDWVETDADGAVERATVQESQDCVELVGYNDARGT